MGDAVWEMGLGVSRDGPELALCFLAEKWGEAWGDQSAPTSPFHTVVFRCGQG